MKPTLILLLNCFSYTLLFSQSKTTDEVCETSFGIQVCDPYRWMEDLESERVQEWLKEERRWSNKYLSSLWYKREIPLKIDGYEPRDYNVPDTSVRLEVIPAYYCSDPSVSLFYRSEETDGELVPLVRSYDLKDGKRDIMGVGEPIPSIGNKYIAVTTFKDGHDEHDIRVIDLENKQLTEDIIPGLIYSKLAWFKDEGFFYLKIEADENQSSAQLANIFYHKIGEAVDADRLVHKYSSYGQGAFKQFYDFCVSRGGKYLVFNDFKFVGQGQGLQRLLAIDLSESQWIPRPILVTPGLSHHFYIIDCSKDHVLIETNYQSPKSSLLSINIHGVNQATEIISPRSDVLEDVRVTRNNIVCLYYSEGYQTLVIHDKNGNPLTENQFKQGLSVDLVDVNYDDRNVHLVCQSFGHPQYSVLIDLENLKSRTFGDFELEDEWAEFITDYVWYTSNDGTKVPMYLTYKNGLEKNGDAPVIIEGYGGYGYINKPYYDPEIAYWLNQGGIYAVPGLRGGGELGGEWHDTGRRLNKHNTIDDFIYAAKFIVDNQYSRKENIVARGTSHGAMVVASAMAKKPEMFEVVILEMGLYDMLGFERLRKMSANAYEYGTVSDSLDYTNLFGYSPLHNLKKKKYPATMIITAENDDRTSPVHSYKFQRALLAMDQGIAPKVLKVLKKAGHYGPETFKDIGKYDTDIYAFILGNIGRIKKMPHSRFEAEKKQRRER